MSSLAKMRAAPCANGPATSYALSGAAAPSPHRLVVRAGASDHSGPGGPAAAASASRRQELIALAAMGVATCISAPAQAIGFKKELKKRKIPIEEYSELADGLKYYDLTTGSGGAVHPGSRVTVHFDCMYKGIDVVSSRSARLLGGNRTISEPFEFLAGEPVKAASMKIADSSAGGLFSGATGPKPPPALSTAVIGMKLGGKRSVIVPPEVGYGARGEQEIPPGASFELKIELLALA